MSAGQGRIHGDSLLVEGSRAPSQPNRVASTTPIRSGYPRAALPGGARVRSYGGFAMGRPKSSYCNIGERFWSNVALGDGCWLWTAGGNSKGYGHFWVNGHQCQATHVSWELTHGPVPNGKWVLHKCDNPPCVRPDHLFLGTPLNNTQDMVAKGRSYNGDREKRHQRIEGNYAGKLSASDVRCIYAAYHLSEESVPHLAQKYGMAESSIRYVVNGTTWTLVTAALGIPRRKKELDRG